MRKNNIHYKEWIIKLNIRKIRKYKNRYKFKKKFQKRTHDYGDHRYIAPKNLSICGNSTQTISYFQKYIRHLLNPKINTKNVLFFDVSEIQMLTNDALMYLLVILNNFDKKIKENIHNQKMKLPYNNLRITKISGNLPNNKDIKQKFIESGFLNFVKMSGKPVFESKNNIQIEEGHKINNLIAKELIDFTASFFDVAFVQLNFLYKLFIELMSNTNNHAYIKEKKFINNWYISARYHSDDKISFTFLDTGEGIPTTIRKKNIEVLYKDSDLLLSAFSDEFNRSMTKLTNRGKGLPKIYNQCKLGYFDNLTVISRKGKLKVNKTEDIREDLIKSLQGTVYYWEISKKNIKEILV